MVATHDKIPAYYPLKETYCNFEPGELYILGFTQIFYIHYKENGHWLDFKDKILLKCGTPLLFLKKDDAANVIFLFGKEEILIIREDFRTWLFEKPVINLL